MRWTPKRKAEIVEQIAELNELERAKLLADLRLSTEELASWCELFTNHGLGALRATRVQEYRRVA